MNFSRSTKKYALASIIVVVMTIVIDRTYFTANIIVESPAENSQQADIQPPHKSVIPEPTITQMSLVNITLPLPPSLQNDAVLKQIPKHFTIPMKTNTASHKRIIESAETYAQAQATSTLRNTTITPNKLQVMQRLNQLVALEGINRTLYFPTSNTQQILAYMHKCVGIDVGGVEQNNLTLFSHKNNNHSQIIRAANGFKTPHEQALLDAYAPNQTLVRLYPQWFDERLGKSIALSLGKLPLTQLSGDYDLRGQSLWLTNITLNHKASKQEWLLSQGC